MLIGKPVVFLDSPIHVSSLSGSSLKALWGSPSTESYASSSSSDDDDVFYLFLQKQKIGAKLHKGFRV
jgi:hypothetical protein